MVAVAVAVQISFNENAAATNKKETYLLKSI
jgi:hypothetical protein